MHPVSTARSSASRVKNIILVIVCLIFYIFSSPEPEKVFESSPVSGINQTNALNVIGRTENLIIGMAVGFCPYHARFCELVLQIEIADPRRPIQYICIPVSYIGIEDQSVVKKLFGE